MASSVDMTGQLVGSWKVIRKATRGELNDKQRSTKGTFWLCECQCEKKTKRIVLGKSLRNGLSASCGHEGLEKDISGQTFNDWSVIRRATDADIDEYGPLVVGTKAYYLCECACGNKRVVSGYDIRVGNSKSCGHDKYTLKDYTGLSIGKWNVIRKATEQEIKDAGIVTDNISAYWICTCNCGKSEERVMSIKAMKVSRGCKNCAGKPAELVEEEKRRLEHSYVLVNIIKELGLDIIEVERYCEDAIRGEVVDLFIPSVNIGIDYHDGTENDYALKGKKKCIDKSLKAERNGVRLVHIYKYELMDERKKTIIMQMLNSMIHGNKKVYARKCELKMIYTYEEKAFNEKYHLQGNAGSNQAYGLFYDGELVSLMSFGRPRFSSNEEWELIRYTVRPDITVIGGAEKLFKEFRRNNIGSLVSYCDLSKFTGTVYGRLGFELDYIAEPNYVWWKVTNGESEALARYKCQKHKLINKGWGTKEQTENEIMESHGYTKIYDCGNARYIIE